MAEKPLSIVDLPLDILVIIFPSLDARSFLALCSTCKAFQQPSIRLDPAYWSYATRSTFRVPNQPIVKHDGDRWQKMYRRLLTQSRVFTWGQNTHGRLGHTYDTPGLHGPSVPHLIQARRGRFNTHVAVPTEMEDTRSLGAIADMQSGGWSTTLLTSTGSLHTAGVLNGMQAIGNKEHLTALTFPKEYTLGSTDTQSKDPETAIRQFSAGRTHILALSDTGKIWSWYDTKRPALQVKFANLDIKGLSFDKKTETSTYGHVKQVVAGWSRSSAFVQGVGIVVWSPVKRGDDDDPDMDTMLLLNHGEVPQTGYQRTRGHRDSNAEKALSEEVGSVENYIMLEHFVVFVTDIGKVFCAKFGEENRVDNICELRQLRSSPGSPLDVQGSFRRFAVFKGDEVITTNQDYLNSCWSARSTDPEQENLKGLRKIPALQHNDVISVAFGDYHYLALHSNGKITSYGTQMQACGSLGLGYKSGPGALARGIVSDDVGNGRLLPHAYTHGRQIWFDERKTQWIDHVVSGRKDEEESAERRQLLHTDPDVQGEVSEWIEQEGRSWDQDGGEDGLGAYFALRVSAAGWHSGALVLVNEELANKEVSYKWEDKNFPRLKLSNGTEMPGRVDFDEWREGRPNWQLNETGT